MLPHDLFGSPSDERRAAHEAGHAVVAYVARWPFEYVTIDRGDRFPDFYGHVQYLRRGEDEFTGKNTWTWGDLAGWLTTFGAGRFGEIVLMGSTSPGSDGDDAIIASVLAALDIPDEQKRTEFQRSRDAAYAVLVEGEAALREVATALVERRALTYEEVCEIVERLAPASLLEIARRPGA